jgi:catechol-2,3-dioxygenase
MNIEKLILQSNNFSQQIHFYEKMLGLNLIDENENSFSVKVGKSILVFEKSTIKSYYHFAFNIPPFQILDALDWAKDRVNILQFEGEDILDFKSWNAKAFYFFDADNNIVEFIDRRNLNEKSNNGFSITNLLEISEIGLPADNISQVFQLLNEKASIKKYSGNYDNFCAAGGEHGLFIIVNHEDKKWLPTELPAKAFPFELIFQNEGNKYFLKFDGGEIFIKKGGKG